MDTSPIIIAGGGIAGLAAALALGDHTAEIFEQAPCFSAVGAGLQLGPNAVRALQKIGAWDAVIPFTSKPDEIHFHDGLTGRLLKRLKLGRAFSKRYGEDYYVAHRSGLHAGLLTTVQSKANLRISRGHKIESLELGLDGVSLLSRGRKIHSPALIATDGVQSILRQQLFPNTSAIDSGEEFHRALLPFPISSPQQLNCVHVWMFPRGHVVHYTVGNPEMLNLVAITQKSESPAHVFAQTAPALQHLLSIAIPQFSQWPGLYSPPLSNWHKDTALLLGDAAHGTLPYMAQGAAMALEDAACLAQVLTTTQSLRHAFAETARRRMRRTQRLHQETLKVGKFYHASGPWRMLRNLSFAMLPDPVLHWNLDWLYKN
jgi:2-polyprenyl-6-methoxyphenol hydroxylase-like FAD-dependent oxidoreductase